MKRIFAALFATFAFGIACKKNDTPPTTPAITTSALTNITTSGATAGGTITSNGGSEVIASGIVLSKKNNTPTINDTVLNAAATSGSFTVNLTNLDFGTTYYIRAYASNTAGIGYGDVITLNTTNDTTKVRFIYNGQTVTYGIIVSSVTGRKWMDRNLGASAVATSLTDTAGYGDFFQWGRLADGHQLRVSNSTKTPSSSDRPDHSNFIYSNFANSGFGDWRIPQNDNLWQGSSGINSPCPTTWHVPVKGEWSEETGITSPSTAFSQLKLSLAGYRNGFDGSIYGLGTQGQYWASTTDFGASYIMSIYPGNTQPILNDRSMGASIRCIKD